ncbi:MAG: protein-glutamate O-methyltransferase CheR [Deltaproteobacteria bacterium]|nr:protein-glutamate O-methyltransferase CheR [Deltaproteobacteria bacterium]
MSLERFRLIRDMVNKHSGIYIPDDNQFLMESRLSERLSHLGLTTFDDYHHYLKYDPHGPTEIEDAIDLLTTNETYFFREDYQLRTFVNDILPELHRRLAHRRRLMIWSAGCSSGEEAYTIAMLILNSGLFRGWDVRIYGSDISRRVLSRARRGVYGVSSFRTTGPDMINRYFAEIPEGKKINEEIRNLCHFGHLNILDEERVVFLGRVDVIFCRNVLIYFDKRSKMRAISLLYDRLNEDGYLLLGHSESLLNLSTAFEIVHLSEDLVYRRPKGSHGV